MSTRQSTPMSDHSHTDGIRKRVCKACDRCRLKKSKCDGSSPCSRCRADNTVCVFGERKKPHDKVYPKGYVEMLEQQQSWLVHGLQVLYHRAIEDESWSGDLLKAETNGHPLTHDILTRLGVLDGSKGERFEETSDIAHRQESSNGTREPYSPVACSSFSPDALSHQEMPPTPPTYNTVPSLHTPIKSEPSSHSPQYGLSLQGVDGPLGSQQWPTNGFSSVDNFSLFDDMEMNTNADYMGLPFDNHIPSPMFNRQALMDSVASNDYEDFNQFLNTNPADIPSI
ncbi:hypothetical protein N7448_004236 [Penicillium atrosanguineum]|uniref:Uncharacterized protein n=1 Tax=Penicillium atrosanguineum TaxID=1132637 RepID=A0A9W9U553_9EURO|nr:fungal-specific transcription factor domain-containing protein [Penicillium atrosanguineum]KAJ5118117.1 hypothetical protein N7526_011140 [Penicillium atrosanguineum]KAJ5140828.1 hypothetical protein N7448_004236 [Penicillium atrosanguineum]KAJ5310740.1 fungal-specific transcription factor domain-containing protein [Penicillium atrosanguineum]KAJ5316263.1 hypothetical protein N7476_006570 [Penicillium atrosanguineum]